MNDILQRVYQAFDPAPLSADDTDLYVDLNDVRGESGVVNRLAQNIRLSPQLPTHQLLAGHRGSGKSTELRKLQQLLESDARTFVVYVESLDDVDANDVDFPEVLIAIMRQMALQLKSRLKVNLAPGYFKNLFDRVKNFLGSAITFEGVELDAGYASISTQIKQSPDARQKIREALEPDTGNLLNAANDVIGTAKLELHKKGYTGLAIIVDDLDKMVLRSHPIGGTTADYLFVHRHAQLTAFDAHMVYSIPLALAYSSAEEEITSLYGSRPPVLSMIKTRTRPPGNKPYKPGLESLRNIIAARLQKAGANEKDVFAGKSRDELIRLCGGQPRELMILVRDALVSDGLPIKSDAVFRVRRSGARAYARQLLDEHWAVVRQVAKNGNPNRSRKNIDIIRDLLDSRAILQYLNYEEWYGVNPQIDLPKSPRRT